MTLKAEAANRNVVCGAGIRNWSVFTAELQALVEAQFGALMPGNAFKWVNTEPTQGVFAFTEADDFVAWADARDMPVRLHTLVWHNSLAGWVAAAVNSGTWEAVIDAHIEGVLEHYPDRTWEVDVVNEAFRESDGLAGGYRNNLWHQAAGGPDYIPHAFERARVYAPSADLFLAEFGIEQSGQDTRRANLLAAVEDWLSQDVPIDGIAIQGHLQVDLDLDKPVLTEFIGELRGMGLAVTISEFDFRDISTLGLSNGKAFEFIGNYAREFLNVAIAAEARQVIAWGVGPEDWSGVSSSPAEQIAAVPFAASPDFEPTPVAYGMVEAFQDPAAAGVLAAYAAASVARSNKRVVVVIEATFYRAAQSVPIVPGPEPEPEPEPLTGAFSGAFSPAFG